jgi:hypothetical protein
VRELACVRSAAALQDMQLLFPVQTEGGLHVQRCGRRLMPGCLGRHRNTRLSRVCAHTCSRRSCSARALGSHARMHLGMKILSRSPSCRRFNFPWVGFNLDQQVSPSLNHFTPLREQCRSVITASKFFIGRVGKVTLNDFTIVAQQLSN